MNHKQLLNCCVEILDSFNPRIHGVLEHLNSCLAAKQVGKISFLYDLIRFAQVCCDLDML